MELQLDIDEDKNCFIISGDISKLTKNYRAKSYLKDFLKAIENIDGTISILYVPDEQETVLNCIQNAFEKYGIRWNDSDRIKNALETYYREKLNFKEFGQKAKGIWNNQINTEEFRNFKNVLENSLLGRRLYDKQLLASFHLAFSQNACNFSVPGAGKTSVVYGAFAYLNSLPEHHPKFVNKLLVIGPLSSFGPWEEEYEECFDEPVSSKRLSGGINKTERERYFRSLTPAADMPLLTLMSYQSVSYNLEALKYFLSRTDHKVMVVLDEAHRIKNVEGGIWAQSVLSLAKLCNARVVLTGTPLPNGYEDIYNLFEFIWPQKEVIPFNIQQLQGMSNNPNDSRIEKLINDISPFFIRIKKSDLGLKLAIENKPLMVKMGSVQREIYDFIENRYIGFFTQAGAEPTITAELTKARLIRLMQAATNPSLLKQPLDKFYRDQGLGDEIFIDDADVIKKILEYRTLEGVPEKFHKVKELVSSLLHHEQKVIIWGTFIQTLKDLQQYLSDNGIESRLLIGEVPVERDDIPMDHVLTREKIIREFHSISSSFKVIIANPFAVAESISLHKACHNAIYLERTFNAATFIQSKDRIHRYGLPEGIDTFYHYLLSEDSIDETIHNRLVEKEQRMLKLIEGQEIPLINENRDYELDMEHDIKALIRDYVRRAITI